MLALFRSKMAVDNTNKPNAYVREENRSSGEPRSTAAWMVARVSVGWPSRMNPGLYRSSSSTIPKME